MIKNTKQIWTVGQTVKVGFMTMTVLAAIATPGDYKPDAYVLGSKGSFYCFVPHNGLTKIWASTEQQAIELVQQDA